MATTYKIMRFFAVNFSAGEKIAYISYNQYELLTLLILFYGEMAIFTG